ncbi:hypothetical protein [Pontimicrobium sp. IMCC45349]|uniref:hypothetical protein n=1 Tax=Pontimicrobium sp. IMCC45349 TaxID=3391574 RepID=UPI0039A358C0
MKTLQFYIVFFLLTNVAVGQELFEAKKQLVYRAYFTQASNDVVFVELGGTSIKIGGEYLVFKRSEVSNNVTTFTCSTNKSYLKYTKGKYSLYYFKDDKLHLKFKFKKVESPESKDDYRFNIFRMFNYNQEKEWKDIKELKKDFKEFKNAPYRYISSRYNL